MQQRTGIQKHGRQTAGHAEIPVVYYAFDLIYLDGYDMRRAPLEQRKELLKQIISPGDLVRYSGHFDEGTALFQAAKEQELEGILAKRRASFYEERRSRDWLKIKITQTLDCVIGGFTDPEGSRQHFGSLILGLYDKDGNLIHVGQAGTGFAQATLKQIGQVLKKIETRRTPFHGPVDASKIHWVKPKLVAEIKFTEWTHETSGGGRKLRAPVFLRLREDKSAQECIREDARAL